ncbi:putative tricarboxylic transport membrane protein [Nocardiopsis sp. Huas11]|uniref:tripartite tricarboxylate transporter TctB family protein n=1 Tax=Nocardiopsis sp. Huas11 TaxID=2183912 RepID=UPI000EB53ADA|nr:tripartite tricarboxylate transporter TctB family protein [Nocardiopsis sp. Huas11]RKS09563.1 putative tricarboxylic transport membrane protein [Nocardiopsis sp. Huas11]
MSDDTTARRDGAPAEGAAPSRPRRAWSPRTPVTPERAFRFSPRTMGITVGLFALGYLALAFQMPDYTAVSVPVQPSTLPRWLGVALLALAVLLFFQRAPEQEAAAGSAAPGSGDGTPTAGGDTEASATEGTDAEGTDGAQSDGERSGGAPSEGGEPRLGRLDDPRLEIGLFVAALVAYVALFEPLGFILSTALYLGSMTWYLGYPRHLVNAVVALVLPFAFYAGMTWGLDVTLPSGPLPF